MTKRQARTLVFTLTLLTFLAVAGRAQADDADSLLAPEPPAPADTPAPSLGTPTPDPAKTAESANPLPPPPSDQPPIPLASIPNKTPESVPPAATPTANAPGADRNVYQDYRDYRDRERDRAVTENEFEQRALFPHEDGSTQFGLDYTRNAFDGYDFDPTGVTKTYSSHGGVLSYFYYPLHSLDYGRLGLGVQAGMFWTKYEASYNDTNGVRRNETNQVHSHTSYGGRVTYEFDYWLGQLFVPHVFYGIEQVSVRAYQLAAAGINYAGSRFSSTIYGGGLHFNLNRVEPQTASRALVSLGVRKFYLTYTAQQRSVGGTGLSHFLGLRFEL